MCQDFGLCEVAASKPPVELSFDQLWGHLIGYKGRCLWIHGFLVMVERRIRVCLAKSGGMRMVVVDFFYIPKLFHNACIVHSQCFDLTHEE